MLIAESLHLKRGNRTLVENLDLALMPGQWQMLIGPNGAGKSTLLHTLAGFLRPHAGSLTLQQQPLMHWSLPQLARQRAVLTQQQPNDSLLSAYEVIEQGLSPWPSGMKDSQLIEEQAQWLGLAALLHKPLIELSGGEQQRVHIARVMVQLLVAPDLTGHYLFLDEPLTGLDLHHQQQLLRRLKKLTGDGLAILCVLHDLNLATLYGTHLLLLADGCCHYQGEPQRLLNNPLIEEIYRLDAYQLRHPQTGTPQWLTGR